MFTKKLSKGLAVIVSTTVFSMSTIQSAYAAPGALATAPLFLSTIVEPNVFFTIDDSGSMDWNPMVADGTAGLTTSGGLPIIDGEDRAYYAHSFSRLYDGSRYVLPPADGTRTEWDRGWVVRTHHGNLNYYNPSITYRPWPGTKADGTPMFTDADPTDALKDPFNPGGESVDLTISYDITAADAQDMFDRNMAVNNFWIAVYFEWDDANGDGIIEQSEKGTRVVIPTDSPGEMQNFANWFQYHRSRINATKSIIGTTINNTDASRMGMRLFNDDQLRDVESMGDPDKKRDLLKAFYDYNIPAQGTPMRVSLHETGDYFRETGGGAPILDDVEGGECQQNFNILMGDGFWNGNTDPGVGNRDINGGDGNTPFDGNAAQSNDGGNYADSWDETLADVAMDNYESDLRTDLNNDVPTQPGIDEADHQHLVTYAIAFGITGTLDPAVDDPLAVGFSWPDPEDGEAEKVDDMWHAAYNGRGEFFSAQQPDELEIALSLAIADIAERTATAAAVSINSAKLTTESVVYLAQFNTNRWQGNLFAFKIVDLNTGELSATPEWTAADQLNARNFVANPRTILTHSNTEGVPFRWTNLTGAQRNDLRRNPAGGTDADVIAQARLDYLRGDRTNEGAGYFFRERLSLLSDLVNSGPVYVGAPALNWPDTAPFPSAAGQRYSEFKEDKKTRAGMVYAGSNGGMLHGFAEADGEEKLAYIPKNLFSTGSGKGLHYLTDPNYIHRYYNDLTPTISDIHNGTDWQTVLVGGQRGGGRGIFALDVTDPATFSEANASDIVLWEFTHPSLGYTFSRPQIALTNAGTWVAIFGNGYNESIAAGGDGKAKLFILDIVKGATDGSWVLGSNYQIINTNTGGTGAARNGLATPALADLDGNGTVDRVYAGDLTGRLWSFDLSANTEAAWVALGASELFRTKGNEPITSKPTLAKHPTVSNDGTNGSNIMVYFGSGQYLVNGDKTSTDDNYFYGVWDRGDAGLDEDDLVEQTYVAAYAPDRVLTRNLVDYTAGGDHGWMVELDINGERSVTNPVVRGGVVFFNTFVPVTDPCSVGGFGYRFALDMVTGGSPDEVTIDTNGDGIIDALDLATDGTNTDVIAAIRQEGFLPEPVFIEDIAYTAEKPSKVKELPEPPTGRFGWQELIQ